MNLWSKLESVYEDNEWARTGRSQQPERCVLLLLATTSEVTMDLMSVELQSLRVQAGSFDQGLYGQSSSCKYATVQSQSRR